MKPVNFKLNINLQSLSAYYVIIKPRNSDRYHWLGFCKMIRPISCTVLMLQTLQAKNGINKKLLMILLYAKFLIQKQSYEDIKKWTDILFRFVKFRDIS